MTWLPKMKDSAYAANIPLNGTRAVAGYVPAGRPFHGWSDRDWKRFGTIRKLPIYVPSDPVSGSGSAEAWRCLFAMKAEGYPRGIITALDMETTISRNFVLGYGSVMRWCGFHVWVYGSRSTVFSNPALDGYWVADYANKGPFMIWGRDVRAVQYASPGTGSGGQWDSSTIKPWEWANARFWR